MASQGLSDNVVVETDAYTYNGQGETRAGSTVRHGRGTCTWKGAYSGHKYEGEWKDGKRSGQGVFTSPDGKRYEGEWKGDRMSGQGVHTWPDDKRYEGGLKDDKRNGRGTMWLPDGRVFDGAWADDRPLQGTAMEPDGTLFLAAFDGKALLGADTWNTAERAPAGRVASGGPPPQGGRGWPATAWKGRVERANGTAIEAEFCGLRPRGPATLVEGGVTYAVEYDGEWTVAEGPVPVRKQVRRAARFPTDG
jgi:hypothetical protein